MALDLQDIARLNERAREVGQQIGWDLAFVVAPNPDFVGVTAGPDHIFVMGPARLSDLAAYDIELELDALERGDRVIRPDEDGDPRML